MIHLYAVVAASGDAEQGREGNGRDEGARLRGIDDAPVQRVEIVDDLHALASTHPRRPVPDRQRALQHFAVVAEVSDRAAAVLPVRYGTTHEDLADLRTELATQATTLRQRLARVAGHVEVLVRFALAPAGPPAPALAATATEPAATSTAAAHDGAGRAYLEGRREEVSRAASEQRSRADALREHTRHLDERATEVVERDGPAGPERCLLVARATAPALLRAAYELTGGGDDDDALVVGGPWPPYTFA